MSDLKKIKSLIILICFVGAISLLFLFYYSTTYKERKMAQIEKAEQEKIEQEKIEQEESIVPDFSTEIILEKQEQSVFLTDLEKKKNVNGSNKLLINTGEQLLNYDIISDLKYDIFQNLYSNNIEVALETANQIRKDYDFSDSKFNDFEILIYEIINYFNDFDNMSYSQKEKVIQNLDNPELILYAYNSLDLSQRLKISKNEYSELFNKELYYSNLVLLGYGDEGLETCGAKNVFFVTSDYKGYHINFSYLGEEYKLYYVKDKLSNQNIIMGIDNLDKETSTIKDYIEIYG